MNPQQFLDPVAVGVVFGGSAASAAFRSTRADLAAAARALAVLVRARPLVDATAADAAVARIERAATERSRAWVDRLEHGQRFVGDAARALAEAADATAFRRWADEAAAELAARHERAAGVWRTLADAAPPMGMLGTVVGLSRLFAGMDDLRAIGPAMALAMLTTFYGLVLSAGVAGPIAARLERLHGLEADWRARVCRRLAALAEDVPAEPAVEPRRRLRLVR